MSGAVSGIDFESADNAVNSLDNRKTNPITVSENSYEKWLRARVDAAPDNYVRAFKVWGDGGVQANTALYYGITGTGITPVATKSAVAVHNFDAQVVGAKATWDDTEYAAETDLTDFLVFQLCTVATATPGNWTQETINYEYEEA